MDKDCLFEYGTLSEGSIFGDISLLTNEPNNYSYFFNTINDKHLFVLTLDSLEFAKICDDFPFSKEILKQRALKKRTTFESYKMITLLKYMQASDNCKANELTLIPVYKKDNLFKMLIFHYSLCCAIRRKVRIANLSSPSHNDRLADIDKSGIK